MSKTLILMRHAKSSWDNFSCPDHERSLNGRGQRSAIALGDWLRDQGRIPDEILCSSSRRTTETCGLLKLGIEPHLTHDLYLAGSATMFKTLQGASGATVLMLGHNPGIAELAEALVVAPPGHPRFHDYPTGATLVAQFDIADWADIEFGTAKVLNFVIPRELIPD